MLGSFQQNLQRSAQHPLHHKSPHKHTSRIRVGLPAHSGPAKSGFSLAKHAFTKVFRWRVPVGFHPAPHAVEIVGSFTHWEKVPLKREVEHGVWTATLSDIPFNRTHHYMLLADGKPVRDDHADGMAIPQGAQEEQYQLQTARGGRVFMLYAQAK